MSYKPSAAFARGESEARYALALIDRADRIPEPPKEYPFGSRERRDWREGYWSGMQKRKNNEG